MTVGRPACKKRGRARPRNGRAILEAWAITHATRPTAPRCSAQPPVAPVNPPCPRQQCVVQETALVSQTRPAADGAHPACPSPHTPPGAKKAAHAPPLTQIPTQEVHRRRPPRLGASAVHDVRTPSRRPRAPGGRPGAEHGRRRRHQRLRPHRPPRGPHHGQVGRDRPQARQLGRGHAMAYQFKYDSIHGCYPGTIEPTADGP